MTGQMQKFGHRESPYNRPSQRWRCGRAGACKSGPSDKGKCPLTDDPCTPELTVKHRKRRVVFLTTGVAILLIVVFFTGKQNYEHLSPGPLSVNHAEVTTCKDCHSAVSESIKDWIGKAVHLSSSNDDAKCLNCHKLGENAHRPHSTAQTSFSHDPELTPAKNASALDVKIASKLRKFSTGADDDLSCAVCHREHQGRFAAIDEFDSQRCHVCHQVKFSEIESEHPQYSNYPFVRATRINFDHVAHLKKHFEEDDYKKRAPNGCKQCHSPDRSGRWILSNSFETTCASCHLEDVLGDRRANAKGVAVFSIPELDVQSLETAGYYVGEWPEWANGEITPFMQLLLSDLAADSPVLQNKSIRLFDLSAANEAELRSAAELAWGVKELLYDIQMGGTALMNRRIADALSGTFDRSTFNRLIASLPKDTLVNNQKEWFPMLMGEVTKYRNGEIEGFLDVTRPIAPEEGATADGTPDIGISRDDTILTGNEIFLDDGGDNALIELGDLDDESLLIEDDDDEADPQSGILSITSDEILLDDDLLDDDAFFDEDPDREDGGAATSFGNEEWARAGGWYRDGSTIYYRPIDHTDPFLKSWLEVSLAKAGAVGEVLFDYLSDEKAVGMCIKCHSVEEAGPPQPKAHPRGPQLGEIETQWINWRGFRPDDTGVEFNRFSHTSHFGLMSDEGCLSCHKLSVPAVSETDETEPSFADMTREICTECHRRGRAPDDCLTCHNYHADPDTRSIERISDFFREAKNGG